MFAVLATAALALSGPLAGRSPHLRSPRPILLEPPAVVDPPLVVEPAVPSAAPSLVPEVPPPLAPPSFAPSTLPVLGLCCVVASLCALDRVVMSMAILPMGAEFGYGDGDKGLIASAFSLGYCAGLLPAGALATATSPKAVLGGGLVLWSAAQAATPLAAAASSTTSLAPLLAARAAMGVGEAAATPTLQVIAANFVPSALRSRYWGVVSAALAVGSIAAYELTPPLIDSRGWAAAFEVYGAAGVALALAWAAVGASAPAVPEGCREPKLLGDSVADGCELVDVDERGAAVEPPLPSLADAWASMADVPWRRIGAAKPVWALTAAHASNSFFVYFALAWLPSYFARTFGMTMADASAATLLPFAAGAVGSLAAGVVCDSLLVETLGLPLTRARKIMQSIACAGPAAAMLALATLGADAGAPAAEALFVFGLGSAAFSAAGFGCAAQDIATSYASLIYGASSAVSVVVAAGGQYLTGVLLERTDGDFVPFFALIVAVELAGLAAFCAWWSSEPEFE